MFAVDTSGIESLISSLSGEFDKALAASLSTVGQTVEAGLQSLNAGVNSIENAFNDGLNQADDITSDFASRVQTKFNNLFSKDLAFLTEGINLPNFDLNNIIRVLKDDVEAVLNGSALGEFRALLNNVFGNIANIDTSTNETAENDLHKFVVSPFTVFEGVVEFVKTVANYALNYWYLILLLVLIVLFLLLTKRGKNIIQNTKSKLR